MNLFIKYTRMLNMEHYDVSACRACVFIMDETQARDLQPFDNMILQKEIETNER